MCMRARVCVCVCGLRAEERTKGEGRPGGGGGGDTGAHARLALAHLTVPINGEIRAVTGQLLETVRYLGIAVSGVLRWSGFR